MDLEEIVELPIHDFNRLVRPIYDRLEQLASFDDGYLRLLLLRRGQALEGSIEVVLDFCIYLRNNVLFFLSDDLNEFEALLSFQSMRLHSFLNAKLGLIPLVLPAPLLILNRLVIAGLLLPSLFHLKL